MVKFKKVVRRYLVFIILMIINIGLLIFFPSIGQSSLNITGRNAIEMIAVIPPIFILLGLLDVWVKRETMVKYMGEGSGLWGIVIAFLLGSAAAGPLYAAFPVAVVLLKKGSKLSNVLIMLGAWSTTKIPLLLFEASSMGVKFTLIRLAMSIIGIACIALVTNKLLSEEDKKAIYERAQKL